MNKPLQIVIAWLEHDAVIERRGRVDLGESHRFKLVPKPMACMWLNKGSAKDLEKAQAFAAKQGHTVFSYTGERDPLGKAKQDILRTA